MRSHLNIVLSYVYLLALSSYTLHYTYICMFHVLYRMPPQLRTSRATDALVCAIDTLIAWFLNECNFFFYRYILIYFFMLFLRRLLFNELEKKNVYTFIYLSMCIFLDHRLFGNHEFYFEKISYAQLNIIEIILLNIHLYFIYWTYRILNIDLVIYVCYIRLK